jgi:hypothetical protein
MPGPLVPPLQINNTYSQEGCDDSRQGCELESNSGSISYHAGITSQFKSNIMTLTSGLLRRSQKIRVRTIVLRIRVCTPTEYVTPQGHQVRFVSNLFRNSAY